MKLVFPTIAYKEKATEFIEEFKTETVNGSGGLAVMLSESYESWLRKVMRDIDIANIEPGRVPALTYFYVREEDDRIVGMTNIRLALNDFLRTQGGNIGYCVRPSERRKGYATQMLRDALRVCRTIDMEEVIVSCDKANIASAKTIRNCGGVLDAEFYSEEFKADVQRYIIDLRSCNPRTR